MASEAKIQPGLIVTEGSGELARKELVTFELLESIRLSRLRVGEK